MYKEEVAIAIENLGKMYKLYKNPKDKIRDAFGLNFYKKNYYKEFWALRDVNITIKKGERVGLIGHNGAGKSTLLKTIIGNIQPTEGNIEINGNIQALLELGTGFHPEFTGRENIKASLAYQGLSLAEIAMAEAEIIDFTELGEYIDQPVRTYSAGMYSRLAFATATAVCPEVLIIDEVLGAGDAYFMGKCVERMRRLTREEGTTVLFVSHDLQSVQALCDRVIWIDKGMMRFDGEVLTGIKLYTQSVRKNEELRLKIRDMKISKNQAMVLDRKQDLYDEYLFRFVSLYQSDAVICRVDKIELVMEETVVASIDIGAPMDNNVEQDNYILDETGVTCWGKSKKDVNGFFREYNNAIGQNKHAPFCMAVSKEYDINSLFVRYKGERVGGKDLKLQYFDKEKGEYVTIAEDDALNHEAEFKITSICNDEETEEEKVVEKVTSAEQSDLRAKNDVVEDIINTEGASISDFKIYDRNNESYKVFSYENNVAKFSFKIHFGKLFSECVVNFLIYSMRGELVISTSRKVKLENGEEEIQMIYEGFDGKFGPGEYTISIGVYEDLDVMDNSREQKFLALVDRGYSFKIEQAVNYGLNLGLFMPNLEVTAKGKRVLNNEPLV